MFLSLLFGTCLSVFVCMLGDKICSLAILQNRRADFIRALADNVTHGLVGGISWWLVLGFRQPNLSILNSSRINQSMFCIFLSSVIDVDHFIAAGSWKMEDVLHLPHRPPMHCTGLGLLITAALCFTSRFYPGMLQLPWEWLVSFTSHHIRDATRRGLWIIPWLLTTKPLPYSLYLALIAAIPLLVATLAPIQLIPLPPAPSNKTFIV